jgi:hypothetical protein
MPVIIRTMLHLLATLGTTALGEIVKKMVTGGIEWAAKRKKPAPAKVEEKLGEIADKNLPDTIPADQRQAVVMSLTDLVMPTFEQIVEYSPNARHVISAAKRTLAKKSSAKWSVKKAAKKESGRTYAIKKATAKPTVTKKSPTRKAATKKAPTKKSTMRRF